MTQICHQRSKWFGPKLIQQLMHHIVDLPVEMCLVFSFDTEFETRYDPPRSRPPFQWKILIFVKTDSIFRQLHFPDQVFFQTILLKKVIFFMKINYSLHNHCFYIKVQQREIQTLWFLLFLLKWKLNTTSFEKCLKTIYKHFFGQETYKNRIENGRNFFEFPLKW